MQTMQTGYVYIPQISEHTQQALARMPVRSAAMIRRIVKSGAPAPEAADEIDRYIHSLLTPEEEKVCEMATD